MPEPVLSQLLSLVQHGDSQFPTGQFASSFGLEGLFADNQITATDLESVLRSMLHARWAPFDRVVLHRCWTAGEDWAAIATAEQELDAALLVPVERTASLRAGRALLKTHERIGTRRAAELGARLRAQSLAGHRAVVEAVLWRDLGWGYEQAAALSGFLFVNALTNAALRLGKLGALEQQRVLAALLEEIAALAATIPDAPPGAFNPVAEVAMMRHPLRRQNLFSN